MVVVAVSGFFDPIHVGHIEYFQKAKKLGDHLVVIVNSDEDAIKKKGYFFMTQRDRILIINELNIVDRVVSSIDTDGSVSKTLSLIKPDIFAKGGDRLISNLPSSEIKICEKMSIKIVTGLGEKIRSSSNLVEKVRYSCE